jgi:hypothetical protein
VQTIYIFDLYGINKNKPNLCIYKELAKNFDIWVDNAPRDLGDVVDVFMAGAKSITLRKEKWPYLDITGIREISENKIYLNIEFEKNAYNGDLSNYNVDGFINFNKKEEVDRDFKAGYFFREISKKSNIYSYESNPKNILYWKTTGVTGLLVDIDKIEEFKKYEY